MIKIESVFIQVKNFQILLSDEHDFFIATETGKFKTEITDFYTWKDSCLVNGYELKGSIFKINTSQILGNHINFKYFFYDMITIFGRGCVKLILAIINNDYSGDLNKYTLDLPLIYNCKHLIICSHLLTLLSRLIIGPRKNFKTDFFFRCKCFIDGRVPMESYICLKTYSIALSLTSFSLKYIPKSSPIYNLLEILKNDIVLPRDSSPVFITRVENIGPLYAINAEKLFTDKMLFNIINCCEYENSIYITENTFIKFLSQCVYTKFN